MSIIASVKVHDGLVLGADSAAQMVGRDAAGNVGTIKAYEHAQKLFQLADLPIGLMSYGIGNMGPRSIGSFILEFSRTLTPGPSYSLEEIANQLYKYLDRVYQETFTGDAVKPELGIFLGGYSAGAPLAEEWEFLLPRDTTPKAVRTPNNFGASWRGVSIPFSRLYNGIDPRMVQRLHDLGVSQEVINQAIQPVALPIVFDGMPMQDAVDFAVFILRTTISVARFEVGIASCGGPLWVAAVTPKMFTWVAEPKLAIEGGHK